MVVLRAADAPSTCYYLNGKVAARAYRCDDSTTGHSTCCEAGATCYSNGVCQQLTGKIQDYLRVGCTDPSWTDPSCLDQCTTFVPGGNTGIRFCNGTITTTNRYCCDDGSSGVGSFECCGNEANIFEINPVASSIAQIPPLPVSSTSTSVAASSTSTPTSVAATITSSSSTPSSSSEASSSSSSALNSSTSSESTQKIPFPNTTTPSTFKSTTSTSASALATSTPSDSHSAIIIGTCVAVNVCIIALVGFGYMYWRLRRKQKKIMQQKAILPPVSWGSSTEKLAESKPLPESPDIRVQDKWAPRHEMQDPWSQTYELPSHTTRGKRELHEMEAQGVGGNTENITR